jgi:hypothetical protein
MESQITQVLTHLKKYKKITSWNCITRYGITRLAAHICVLRQSHNIVSVRITDEVTGKWWVEYKYMGAK